jgi:hypothetical protein
MEYFRSRFHLDKKTGRNTGKSQEGEGGNGYAECIRQNTSSIYGSFGLNFSKLKDRKTHYSQGIPYVNRTEILLCVKRF